MKKPTLFFVAISLLFTQCSKIQPKPGDEELDTYLSKKFKKMELVGMQTAYLKNGKLGWANSYGIKNVDTGELVDDKTLFMIASSSKPVTAAAIMRLVELDKIALDNDINDYLRFAIRNPSFPNKPITVRMLLSHVSSLKDNWDVLDPLYTTKEGGDSPIKLKNFILDYFKSGGQFYDRNENFFQKQPGTYWEYSNMGYALLGLIIQEVSGKPFEQFMIENFFLPLGMDDSYWFLSGIPHENIARPHELSKKKAPNILPHYGYPDFPDGQLRTTVTDYARFLEVFLNDGKANGIQFLSAELVEEFLKVQFPSVHKHQAIAWNYDEMENFIYYRFMPRLPSHTGGDPGVASVVSFDPVTKTGAIIFVNSPPVGFLDGKNLYLDIMKRLFAAAY